MRRALLYLALPLWLLWAFLYGMLVGGACCAINAYFDWERLCDPSSSPQPS